MMKIFHLMSKSNAGIKEPETRDTRTVAEKLKHQEMVNKKLREEINALNERLDNADLVFKALAEKLNLKIVRTIYAQDVYVGGGLYKKVDKSKYELKDLETEPIKPNDLPRKKSK